MQLVKEFPIEKRYGYVRVSSKDQETNYSLETQREQLLKAGISAENIRQEIGSGTLLLKDRPVLSKLINNELKKGDLLVVTKLDRCCRNAMAFLELEMEFKTRQITFLSLDLPYSEDRNMHSLISTIIASIASFRNRKTPREAARGYC